MRVKLFAMILVPTVLVLGTEEAVAQDALSCRVEATWINSGEELANAFRGGSNYVLSLLVQVGRPASACLPADVSLTAAYLDRRGNVLCVGTMDRVASVRRHVQDVTIEIAPNTLGNFARWKNEPDQRAEPPFSSVRCTSVDGRMQFLDTHLDMARFVELTATVLPEGSGLATTMLRLRVDR